MLVARARTALQCSQPEKATALLRNAILHRPRGPDARAWWLHAFVVYSEGQKRLEAIKKAQGAKRAIAKAVGHRRPAARA